MIEITVKIDKTLELVLFNREIGGCSSGMKLPGKSGNIHAVLQQLIIFKIPL